MRSSASLTCEKIFIFLSCNIQNYPHPGTDCETGKVDIRLSGRGSVMMRERETASLSLATVEAGTRTMKDISTATEHSPCRGAG